MHSIIYRITGLMFLIVTTTVLVLISLANLQMEDLFQQYLMAQSANNTDFTPLGTMGQSEEAFLSSVHQSLLWVGLVIVIIGLLVSFLVARSITVPLRKLSSAAEKISKGDFAQKVEVKTNDEIGQLSNIFNNMASSLASNNLLRQHLFANITHELRTPLAIIQGNLEGMIDGVVVRDKEQLISIHEEAVRLNHLIRDLRDLSLAEVNRLELEKEAIDINHLISKNLLLLKPLTEEKQLVVECFMEENLPPVLADADRMSQVFYNILLNGVKYSEQNGFLKVTTNLQKEGESSFVKISFCDSGAGIAKEDLPYIFEHFYRGDKSRDRKSGGSGIGLSIVKQLVEIHGGKVGVKANEAKGTTFIITLPVT